MLSWSVCFLICLFGSLAVLTACISSLLSFSHLISRLRPRLLVTLQRKIDKLNMHHHWIIDLMLRFRHFSHYTQHNLFSSIWSTTLSELNLIVRLSLYLIHFPLYKLLLWKSFQVHPKLLKVRTRLFISLATELLSQTGYYIFQLQLENTNYLNLKHEPLHLKTNFSTELKPFPIKKAIILYGSIYMWKKVRNIKKISSKVSC